MTRVMLFFLVSAALCACSPARTGGIPKSYKDIALPEVSFHPEKPERWVLPNGLVVLLREDRELPIVSGQLLHPGGTLREHIPGLASAMASQLREGSFSGMSPQALDKTLDSLGAAIESKSGAEFGTIAFSSLREDLPQIFGILAKLVRTPAFDRSRLELWKSLSAEGISRRREDPETMATMTFDTLIFGENNPYSWEVSVDSLARISPAAIRRFYSSVLRPNGSILAVTGDIDLNTLKSLVERELGGWPTNNSPLTPIPEMNFRPKPGIYLIERDFDQSTIITGHQGPPRLTPDQFSISVFNRAVTDGNFGSILFNEIRSRRGLAYVVDGGFSPGAKIGAFEVALGTRSPEAVNALAEVMRQIELTRQSELDTSRITETKSAQKHAFIFNFAEAASVVNRAAFTELLGYPPDFDKNYIENLSQVTGRDVLDLAKRRIVPETFVSVIVGRVKPLEIERVFGSRYPVRRVDFDTAPRIAEN